ncbi:hypothetical protein ACLI1A_01650 [Flavobacterium sp. RHBU_3]|uniref:hypothetical protein n=1 Tax=Flavobacterium sp. RHBU_3 TaxID=3391184 RepID=UPI0039846AE8
MKRKSLNLAILATIAVLSLAISGYLIITQPRPEIKNAHLFFRNSIVGPLNPLTSLVVVIDGKTICSFSKISEIKDQSINLYEGKHTIRIHNLEKTIDNTADFVVNENKEACIYISYRYFPEYETYLPYYKKNYLAHIKQQNKNIDTIATKKRIDSIIDINYLKTRVGYKPEAPNFKIVVQDYPNVIL